MGVDPRFFRWKGGWRWFTEEVFLEQFKALEEVEEVRNSSDRANERLGDININGRFLTVEFVAFALTPSSTLRLREKVLRWTIFIDWGRTTD